MGGSDITIEIVEGNPKNPWFGGLGEPGPSERPCARGLTRLINGLWVICVRGGSYSLGEPFTGLNLIVGDPDGATFLLENRALSPKLTKTLTCSPVFCLN